MRRFVNRAVINDNEVPQLVHATILTMFEVMQLCPHTFVNIQSWKKRDVQSASRAPRATPTMVPETLWIIRI